MTQVLLHTSKEIV